MIEIAAKLIALDMPLGDDMVVLLVLRSLPKEFDKLKITYNTQKDKWTLNELIAVCVQEYDRLKPVTISFVQTTTQETKPKSGKKTSPSKKLNVQNRSMKINGGKGNFKCFFCKLQGHMKKDCGKYKTWKTKREATKPEETRGK